MDYNNPSSWKRHNLEDLELEGFSSEQVHFHLYLMEQAGLIIASDVTGAGTVYPTMIPECLSWSGYEFLDVARNDGVWNRAKGSLVDKGFGMGFETLKALLLRLTQDAIQAAG